MKLPAAPYFSDSSISLEARPLELQPGDHCAPPAAKGPGWLQAALTGIMLGAAIALMGFWLDSLG